MKCESESDSESASKSESKIRRRWTMYIVICKHISTPIIYYVVVDHKIKKSSNSHNHAERPYVHFEGVLVVILVVQNLGRYVVWSTADLVRLK